MTLLRNTHWQNGHLQDLADSIPDFIKQQEALDAEKPSRRNRSANYPTVLEHYLAYFTHSRADVFAPFGRTVVAVSDTASVSVRPTIGLRVALVDHMVVMTMGEEGPNEPHRQATEYFLQRALIQHPVRDGCRPGIFDVRQQMVLPSLTISADVERDFLNQVAEFEDML